jgi:hypothetical protein
MSDTVRVYDPDTRLVTTIPARELAPGMVRSRVTGVDGVVWLPEAVLRRGGIRHGAMPRFRPLFRRLSETFAEVHPITPEQWEDGFRRDAEPLSKFADWVRIADAYERFAGRLKSPDGRLDLLHLLLACVHGRERAFFTADPRALPRALAEEAADYVCRTLAREESEALTKRFFSGD